MTKNLIVEINQDIGKRSDKIQSVLSEKNFCIIREFFQGPVRRCGS